MKDAGSVSGKGESWGSSAGLERRSVALIAKHLEGRPKAEKMWELLQHDLEVRACWRMANFITIRKLGMNDHGETHAKVATAAALTMLDLLRDADIKPDLVASGLGDMDDAVLVVLAATLCHDFGNQIHREAHSDTSIVLALPILDRLLAHIYDDLVHRTIVRSFILSGINSHLGEPRPLTIESALVCIGDSTDMTKGRGRAAFESGSITIHSVSALSIEQVTIRKGEIKPIELWIEMSNSAGIFQVQEILAPRVRSGPLAEYVDVIAVTRSGKEESRIVEGIRMDGARFLPFGERKSGS